MSLLRVFGYRRCAVAQMNTDGHAKGYVFFDGLHSHFQAVPLIPILYFVTSVEGTQRSSYNFMDDCKYWSTLEAVVRMPNPYR